MALLNTVTTLRQFREQGQTIVAYCSHYWVCSHHAQLELDLLATRVGWSFDFFAGRERLAARLYCSICGWYYPTFALGHATRPPGFAGSHSAGQAPVQVADAAMLQLVRHATAPPSQPWVGKRKGGRKFGRS
jgi:hypothetical protein